MTRKADIRAEAERLRDAIAARGARLFEADILQPAGSLLDLYGEDIRARAFVTHDPLRGEMMLRPDFTVPLVERHMEAGGGAGRYTYLGEVFRRQEDDPERANEYLQVGYEVLGEPPRDAEAEVYATFSEMLAPLGLRAAMGDIGLLATAVEGLETSDMRKAALFHHLWRPRRFRALLDRFASVSEPLAVAEPVSATAEFGVRSAAEVQARRDALQTDLATPPLAPDVIDAFDTLLSVRAPAPEALDRLGAVATRLPALAVAVETLAARFEALRMRGIDLSSITFEASYGRTALEYYDGMVFGFYAEGRADLPPVATGGRYDALTRAIGGVPGVAAVGGVIRPGLTLMLGEGAA